MTARETFDVVVVGGGPAGATAATDLAGRGRSVLLLDRAGRIKPCGGAIPPRLIRDFDIPDEILVARATGARMHSPGRRSRSTCRSRAASSAWSTASIFDEWLRERAAAAGAVRRSGTFETLDRDAGRHGGGPLPRRRPAARSEAVRARSVIGADGALSAVGKQAGVPGADRVKHVFAYHEIVRTPAAGGPAAGALRHLLPGRALARLLRLDLPARRDDEHRHGLGPQGVLAPGRRRRPCGRRPASPTAETIRREGAPIPLKPLRRWDNGRDVVLAGDAAGVVAPASGEGIYYAMLAGRLAGEAVQRSSSPTGDARALRTRAHAAS